MILDGVDVGLVTLEVLNVVASPHVPNERHLVAGLKNIIVIIFYNLTVNDNLYSFPFKCLKNMNDSSFCILTVAKNSYSFNQVWGLLVDNYSYSWDESVWVWPRCQVDGHNVGGVAVEALQQLTRLNIPESAGRVAGSGQDLIIGARKKAARHVTRLKLPKMNW